MNWQCNYCGHRTQPVKEIKEAGDDFASRADAKSQYFVLELEN